VTDFFLLARFWSCNSSQYNDLAMGLTIKESQSDSHISKRFSLLLNVWAGFADHQPLQWVPGALMQRVKQLGYEDDHHCFSLTADINPRLQTETHLTTPSVPHS
jgi:hypothetical protein